MDSERLSLLFELIEFCEKQERQASDLMKEQIEALNKAAVCEKKTAAIDFELGWLGIKTIL